MSKSRPQVKGKLNKWYDWLINHVPKPIKDGASKAFKTFKDKVMGLYDRIAGSTQQSTGPSTTEQGAASSSSYLPLPDWLARKKAIVNPHNNDEECFKWSVIAAEK